ncbi:autotransporter outer membrane beta-barrel domain-containing protein [Pseudomonas sp. RIT-PI-S]|uniref:autotransporter outer membrane beta-barrel domain-containing protein n=1 Tax=Pseudomonas sp. RIT-PI-S TaxID=3035295 RepID=UPI0021DB7539|nr:autotransporter outer membrane beta-barrel domain-containing protein [Pseudomonas sp. RIT-PI-S]
MARDKRSGQHNNSLVNLHPHPTPRALAWAVALAVGSFAAQPAFAACGTPGTTVISGASTGPCTLVAGSTLKVTSSGSLSSDTAAAATADHVSGSLNILNAGTITGKPAISLTNSTLTGGITNYSTGTLGGAAPNGTAVLIKNTHLSDGVVNNGKVLSGSSNGNGLDIESSITGGLRNRGEINAAVYGVLALESTINGDVNNSGDIQSRVIGVSLNSDIVNGDVISSGKLRGAQYGLAITGTRVNGDVRTRGLVHGGTDAVRVVNSTVTGQLLTQDTITANDTGIELYNSKIAGDMINEAAVTAREGILVNSNLRGNLINRGHIAASSDGLALYNATVKGTVQNSGTISLEGGTVQGDDIPQAALGVHFNSAIGGLYNTGSITSSDRIAVEVDTATVGSRGIKNVGGTLSGRTGLFIDNSTVNGLVSNTGSITGVGGTGTAAGVRVRASQLQGGLSNAGDIAGTAMAISFDNSGLTGNLNNSGHLTGTNGVRLEDTTVDGSVLNSGSVTADAYAIALVGSDISGDVVNTGTVRGGDKGLLLSGSTVLGAVRNSASLTAHTAALEVTNSYVQGGIVNTGHIESPAGVRLGNSRVASIDNRGVIQGGDDGVLTIASTQIAGDINNRGSLLADSTSPFTLLLVDSQVGGRLVSSGIISGQAGINLRNTDIAGGIDISGQVLGDAVSGYAVNIDADSSVAQLRISGNDSARFSGIVHASNTPVQVTAGSTFTLQDGNRFEVPTFENRGTLAVAASGPNLDDPSAPAHAAVATLQGDYLQTSGATFSTRVADGTTYGHLVVSGTATLPHQANVYVNVANPAQPFSVSSLDNVISAGTLASDGTYNVTSNSQLFNFSGVKDANTLDLKLAAKSATGVRDAVQGNSAAQDAARVLDSQLAQGSSSALSSYFVSATSGAEVARAVTQSLPLTNALPASQFMLEQITDTLRERLAESPMLGTSFAQPQGGVWIKPFGARMADNQRASSGFAANVGGTLFGADAVLSKATRVGVAFAYGNSQANDEAAGSGHNNQLELYQFTAYGSHLLDDVTELSVHAGMGHNQSDGRRTLNFGGSNSQADASVDSQIFTSGVALSRRLPLTEATTLTPSLSADYTRVHDDAYRESGASGIAPLLLDVKARTTDQLLLGFDTRVSHDFAPGIQLKGKLGVAYDLLDEGNVVTAAFAGAPGQTFRTPGSDLGPWVLRGGLEFASVSRRGTSLSFAMDMQTRAGYTEQTSMVKLSVPF